MYHGDAIDAVNESINQSKATGSNTAPPVVGSICGRGPADRIPADSNVSTYSTSDGAYLEEGVQSHVVGYTLHSEFERSLANGQNHMFSNSDCRGD